MSNKRASKASQSVQTAPPPTQWEIGNLLERAAKYCEPHHNALLDQLPAETVIAFASGIVRAFEDIQAGRETLTEAENNKKMRQLARQRAEQNIDELLELIRPKLEKESCTVTADYREELILEMLTGSWVEFNALTNSTSTVWFLKSRELPGYTKARASVKRIADSNDYDCRKKWPKAFFGTSLHEMIATYWLPMCLWCFDTSDAIRMLADVSPGAMVVSKDAEWAKLEESQRNLDPASPRLSDEQLLCLRSKSRIPDLNKNNFGKAISVLRLWRPQKYLWKL